MSAKGQRAPLVLSPEHVKLGLAQLHFRDQRALPQGLRLIRPEVRLPSMNSSSEYPVRGNLWLH